MDCTGLVVSLCHMCVLCSMEGTPLLHSSQQTQLVSWRSVADLPTLGKSLCLLASKQLSIVFAQGRVFSPLL